MGDLHGMLWLQDPGQMGMQLREWDACRLGLLLVQESRRNGNCRIQVCSGLQDVHGNQTAERGDIGVFAEFQGDFTQT